MAQIQTPITIEKVLDRIQDREYLLPAIQREFIWKAEQICMLFDSLMRGYPIGSFLFWELKPATLGQFRFYEFIRNYHQLNAPHCPPYEGAPKAGVTAILDGQQRLSSLNIGLRGSHAQKLPYKWANNLDAYPRRFLYLNLAARLGENDLGLTYEFTFLTEQEADGDHADNKWFRVGDILQLDAGGPMFHYVKDKGLVDTPAFDILHRLHTVIRQEPVISYFLEEEQDIDKVLNIFIRVNSGGTVLSYSDLLLSIAVAQWKDRDARDAVHGLVDRLNETRYAFTFSKDLVLKAGLVLTDQSDIRFKVSNFNQANMLRLERDWDDIDRALEIGASLLGQFGFSGRTLAADSVLIPIAYYLSRRQARPAYLDAAPSRPDRANIRDWVVRSLIKQGIWGSALDTLLSSIRKVIADAPLSAGFPTDLVETEMARLGKTLKFTEEEIQDLVTTPYSNRRVFALLTLLYPGVDVRNVFHEDHIFPASKFTRSRLRKAGLSEDRVAAYMDMFNRLPNLQLLDGAANVEKQAVLPLDWARKQFPDENARQMYLASHDMHDLPDSLEGFQTFYRARADRMAARLRQLLRVAAVPA